MGCYLVYSYGKNAQTGQESYNRQGQSVVLLCPCAIPNGSVTGGYHTAGSKITKRLTSSSVLVMSSAPPTNSMRS